MTKNYTDYLIECYLLEWSATQIQAFKNKFGNELFKSFEVAKDRLKNNGYTTDIQYYLSNKFDAKDLEPLLLSLYKNSESQRKREITNKIREVRGKYNFFGEHDGYLIYQPLDYISSMDLGINTGWCTSGRYEHAGHPEFTPDEAAAYKHFYEYTKQGIKLYYFLNKNTFYGEYALALYPSIEEVEEEVYDKASDTAIYIERTNYELYDSKDAQVENKEILSLAKNILKLNLVFEGFKEKLKNGLDINETGHLSLCYDKEAVDIAIPDGVKFIDSGAFMYCKNLQKVIIPDSVEHIDDGVFEQDTIVYTNNKYAIDYCKKHNITVKENNYN